jgi:hypothetical protein
VHLVERHHEPAHFADAFEEALQAGTGDSRRDARGLEHLQRPTVQPVQGPSDRGPSWRHGHSAVASRAPGDGSDGAGSARAGATAADGEGPLLPRAASSTLASKPSLVGGSWEGGASVTGDAARGRVGGSSDWRGGRGCGEAGDEAGVATCSPEGFGASILWPSGLSGVPQALQNRAGRSTALPQEAQTARGGPVGAIAVPHSRQNRSPLRYSLWHEEHSRRGDEG